MRLDELTIRHFGHFGDHRLRFDEGNGLFLLHGPNEAGKTTLLHAIRYLLFGFPQRTPYGYAYGYTKMAVDAVLRDREGTTLRVRRHKRRKNPLTGERITDAGITPLDAERFASLLGNISEESYTSLFGFTCKALQRGAEVLKVASLTELLAGGALGGSGERVHEVLDALQSHCDELFRPRGRNPLINNRLRRLEQRGDDLRDAIVGPATYRDLISRLDTTRTDLAELEESLGELEQKQARDQRLLQAFGDFREQRDARERLETEELQTPFDAETAALLLKALDEREERVRERARMRREADDLTKRIDDIRVDEHLLERGPTIERLVRRLEQVADARARQPIRQRELDDRRHTLTKRLERLFPERSLDDLETCLLSSSRRESLEQAFETHHRLRKEREDIRRERKRHRIERAQVADQLADMPPGDTSERLRTLSTRLPDVQRAWEEADRLRANLETVERDIEQTQADLQPPLDDPDAPLPSRSRLEQALATWNALQATLSEAETRLNDRAFNLRGLQEERTTLVERTDVPTPGQLGEIRAQREKLWKELRSRLLRDEPPPGPENNESVAAFEESLRKADDLADRMRIEAERVATLLELDCRIARKKVGVEQAERSLEEARTELESWKADWEVVWAPTGIQPDDPTAMMVWLETVTTLRKKHTEAETTRTELEALEQRVNDFLTAARKTLEVPGAERDEVAARLRERERVLTRQEGRREELNRQERRHRTSLHQAEARLDGIEAELEATRQQIEGLLADISFPVDPDPAVTERRLREFGKLREEWEELLRAERKLEETAAMLDRFDEEVAELSRHLDRTVEGEQGVEQLQAELTAAVKAESARDQAAEQSRELDLALRDLDEQIQTLDARLAPHFETAVLEPTDKETLRTLARRTESRSRLQTRVAELESRLVRILGEGEEREANEERLASLRLDELESRLADREQTLESLREERREKTHELGRLETRLAHLGVGDAAEIAEDLESLRSELASGVRSYTVHAVARSLLQRVVARFAREHQPALLQRTSDLVRRITGGRYVRVLHPFGESTLVVEAREGERLRPDALSTGTREQLFLALRLAYVLEHAVTAEPLPLVLDDVLVNADPDRARRTLEALVDVSASCQVLFLTCHEHLLDLARDLPGTSVIDIDTAAPEESDVKDETEPSDPQILLPL